MDEAGEVFDFDALVSVGTLGPASGAARRDFLSDLHAHIRRHPTLAWEAPFKATIGGWQTDDLLGPPVPI